jgi:hypothetical protein
MLSFKYDSNKTYDYGTNYTILDQLYDALSRVDYNQINADLKKLARV